MKTTLAIACILFGLWSVNADHQCGGPGGSYFTDENYSQYGDISGFKVWTEGAGDTCQINGIQLRYGAVMGPAHNPVGFENERLFAAGETITGVTMDTSVSANGDEALTWLTIFTNERTYGPFCNEAIGRCGSAVNEEFRYISGRTGEHLDFLTWHS